MKPIKPISASIILASFMFLFASSNEVRYHDQLTLNKIPFRFIHDKTILPVKIGDSRTFSFILDSGLGFDGLLVMNPGLQDSILLRNVIAASIEGAGSGSNQNAIFSDSMSFTVGNTSFVNQRIIILRGDSFKGFLFDGVVGYSLFGHYQVEIDNDNNIITLHENDTFRNIGNWVEIPLWFNKNNIPFINVKVSVGKEQAVNLSCYIDYASSEVIELLQSDHQKFSLPEKTEEFYLGRGLNGDIHGRKGTISKIIVGPYTLNNVQATFVPSEIRSRQGDADGVVANSLLRKFNLLFDYQNKKMYIKPNSHYKGD